MSHIGINTYSSSSTDVFRFRQDDETTDKVKNMRKSQHACSNKQSYHSFSHGMLVYGYNVSVSTKVGCSFVQSSLELFCHVKFCYYSVPVEDSPVEFINSLRRCMSVVVTSKHAKRDVASIWSL